MSEPRPPATDDADLHWFEVLGGMAAAPGEGADAVALRRVLGQAADAAALPATDGQASLALLLQRLDQVIADENREWFEAIGGAEQPDSAGATEGRLVRNALHAGDAPAAATAGAEAELLRRIAALTPTPPTPRAALPQAAGWRRWTGWLFAPGHGARGSGFALAAVAVLAIGIGLVRHEPPDDEVVRSGLGTPRVTPEGSPLFDVASPEAAARAFAQALGDAGVPATVAQEAEFWSVRAALPEPLGDAAAQVLQRYQVPVPADRRLEVVFVKKR